MWLQIQLPYSLNSQVPYDKYLEVSITTLVSKPYEKHNMYLQNRRCICNMYEEQIRKQ
jgi:hypothetical protein